MKTLKHGNIWLFSVCLFIMTVGLLFVGANVLAAQTGDAFGLEQAGAATGLGSTDIRMTVARIIKVALSLLGIVALALILYGGYRYMTAAGNEENIAQAKRILINATIGLAIILSAFAITQFVLRQLGSATGALGFESNCADIAFANANRVACGEPGGGRFSCAGNTGGPFVVRSITPSASTETIGMNNLAVRMIFSQPLDQALAVGDIFTVSRGGTEVSRDFTYQFVDGDRSIVEARLQTNQATAPGGLYEVRVGQVSAVGGAALVTGQTACGIFRGDAAFRVTTEGEIDTVAPTVRNVNFNGLTFGGVVALPRGRSHLLSAEVRDNQGVGYVRLEVAPPAGNRLIVYDGPLVTRGSQAPEMNPYVFQYPILLAGNATPNETYTIRLTAFDIDHNQAVQETQFRVVGENCEFGIGAGDGAACRGNGACQADGDCVSGSCDRETGQCRAVPVITNVSPWESGGGAWVTVLGQFFGNDVGQVAFGRNVTDADSGNDVWVPARLAQCGIEDVWHDGFIIVEVPRDDAALPNTSETAIRVTRAGAGNLSDTTADNRGPRPGPRQGLFRKDNNLTRPGLCRVVADEGDGAGVAIAALPNTAVRAIGQGLQDTPGQIFFGGIQGEVRGWTPTTVQSRVPRNFQPGLIAVTVRVGGAESNGIPFRVLGMGEDQMPIISTVAPTEITRESFVTITGERLGVQTGLVFFAQEGTNTCPGANCVQAVIPEACSDGGWQDTQVIVAVPRTIAFGAYRVILQDAQGRATRPSTDAVRVIDDLPRPGICALSPDTGPAPLPLNHPGLTINGANLGENVNGIRVLFFRRGAQTADLDPTRATWLSTQASDIIVDTSNQALRTRIPVSNDGFSAQTGDVVVAVGGDNFSNPVRYTVLNCSEPNAQIPAGFQCCVEQGRGVVRRNDFVCEGQIRDAAYVWRFTTGRIPVIPQVVVACNQANWTEGTRILPFPSPTPSIDWQQGRSACINGSVAVRFTTDMDLLPAPVNLVNGTPRFVRLFRCADGSQGNSDCSGTNRTDVTNQATLRYANRALFIREVGPAADLQANTWYHVELLTNLQSLEIVRQNGVNVQKRSPLLVTRPCGADTAFCFDFKTGDNQTRCELYGAGILPDTHTVNRLGQLLSPSYPATVNIPFYYYLWGRGNQVCSVLPVDGLGWNWRLPAPPAQTTARQQSAAITLSAGDGYTDTRATGQALSDNAPDGAIIEAQNTPNARNASQLTARTTLTIDLGTPRVTNFWPNCSEACVNATLGVEFNRQMDPGTYANGFRVFRCDNEAQCNATDVNRINEVQMTVQADVSNRLTLRVLPQAGALVSSTWYWVEVSNRILSVGQVDEAGNIVRQGPPLEPKSWRFRTKADGTFCTPDQVRIQPDPFTAFLINEKTTYSAAPFTKPDVCSVRGQELNPWQYGWRWQSENANVAAVSTLALGGTGRPQPGCTAQCLPAGSDIVRAATAAPLCGNMVIDPGEDCDITVNGTFQEVASVSCSLSCLRPGNANAGADVNQCGNGAVESQFGEECDSTNRAICTERCTWAGSPATFNSENPGASWCGSGAVTPGEECEIGVNNETAATCAANCLRRGTRLSQRWCDANLANLNEAARAVCGQAVSVCGNNVVETGEMCEIIAGAVRIYNGDNPSQPIASDAPAAACIDQCLLQNICNTNVTDVGPNRLRCDPLLDEGCNPDCTLRGSSVSLYSAPSLCGDGRLTNQPLGIGEYAWCEAILMGSANPNRQNPVQLVRAVGRGTVDPVTRTQQTTIGATVMSIITQAADLNAAAQVTGQGQYRLQCGYTEFTAARNNRFNDCPNANQGVGTDSCCYQRPRRTTSFPADGQGLPMQVGNLAERVCRNAAIRVTFNGEIDEATIRNNILLARGYATASTSISTDVCAQVGGINVTNIVNPTIISYLGNEPGLVSENLWQRIWSSLRRFAIRVFGSVVHASRFQAQNVAVWCAGLINLKPEVTFVYGGENNSQVIETSVLLPIDRLLDADATYALFLRGGLNGIKDTRGVGISSPDPGQTGRDDSIIFRTLAGDGVCRIASLWVDPTEYLYTRANSSAQFAASAISANGQPITPIPRLYDWRWGWGPASDPLFAIPAPAADRAPANPANRATVRIASTNLQGSKTATANATITADIGGQPGAVFTGTVKLRSLFCNNPWPPRQWYPFNDGLAFGEFRNNDGVDAQGIFNGSVLLAADLNPSTADTNPGYFNFRMAYCADAGKSNEVTDDLPYLRPFLFGDMVRAGACVNADVQCFINADCGSNSRCLGVQVLPATDVASTSTLKRYLFFNKKNNDAIGIQIFANTDRETVFNWYQRNFGEQAGFRQLRVSGYEAMADGANNNIYVNALNQSRTGEIFNNIYLFSINANAQDNTREVFKKLMDSLEFNINISDVGYCLDASVAPDTLPPDTGALAISTSTCQTDFECRDDSGLPRPGTNGVCSAAKTKFLRDWQRLQLIRDAQARLSFQAPELRSGTYIPGQSISRWPSWGVLNIGRDPINRWTSCGVCQNRTAAGLVTGCTRDAECVNGQGDRCQMAEQQTCWDAQSARFICPRAQSVFTYEKTDIAPGYRLRAPLEYFRPDSTVVTQFVDPTAFTTTPICAAQVVQSPFSQTCGDGVVNPATEQCDPSGQTRLTANPPPNEAVCAAGQQSLATCTEACVWRYDQCQAQGRCGNELVETGERCDDGARNGTYGSCAGPQSSDGSNLIGQCQGAHPQFCGNGQIDQAGGNRLEVCDIDQFRDGNARGFCLNARGNSFADYGRSWIAQTSGVGSNTTIRSIAALDSGRAWLAADGGILSRTADGGRIWTGATLPAAAASANFLDVFFIDRQTGWAAGSNRIILRTTDAGENWQVAQTLPDSVSAQTAFTSVQFVDANNGWVTAGGGVVLRTTDGGQRWQIQRSNTTMNLNNLYFSDRQSGIIVGGSSAGTESVILRTTDGGATWIADRTDDSAPLWGIDFVDRNTGWIVGVDRTLLKTEDGGVNWRVITSQYNATSGEMGTVLDWRAVDFFDAQTGFIIDDRGGVWKSINGGQTFTRQATPTIRPLTSISFADSVAGWAVGGNATLLKTGVVICNTDSQCNDGDAVTLDTCAAVDAPDYHPEQINSCALDCQRRGGYCGDGVLQGQFEQCDDGNRNDNDNCANSCLNRTQRGSQTLAVSAQCGNDAIDAGEVCDRGVFNGLACTPAYNQPCVYCARDCRGVLTVDPVSFCGNRQLDVVSRNAQGRSVYEACEQVGDRIIYFDSNQTPNIQTRISLACAGEVRDAARNFYTSMAGQYQCLASCQNYTNNCVACGHKNVAAGGVVPRLAVLNVMESSFRSTWGPRTSVALRFRPSADQPPGTNGEIVRELANDSDGKAYTAMRSFINSQVLQGRGVESRPICDGLYAVRFRPQTEMVGTLPSDHFPYPVAGEGTSVDNEIVVSPAVPARMVRVVVRWTDRESNNLQVSFGGGVFNRSFSVAQQGTNQWRFCPQISGQPVCSPLTYSTALSLPAPGVCSQIQFNQNTSSRYNNYWVPANCYAADSLAQADPASVDRQDGGIWFHRQLGLERSFVQAITIDMARLDDNRPYAFFVEAIGQLGPVPIANYTNSLMTVEVYEFRQNQNGSAIYQPQRTFQIRQAAGSSSNPLARYWHVFNFTRTASDYQLTPVQNIQTGFQDIIDDLILADSETPSPIPSPCTMNDWRCEAFPTACPLAGTRSRNCSLINQACTDPTAVRPSLTDNCIADCRGNNLIGCTTLADCQSVGGVFNLNICVARNSVGVGGQCSSNDSCVAGSQCNGDRCRVDCTTSAWSNCTPWGVCNPADGQQTRTCQLVNNDCMNSESVRAQAERQTCISLPDLRVEAITGPAQGLQGQNLQYTARVCNRGTVNVGATGTVAVRARYMGQNGAQLRVANLTVRADSLNVNDCVDSPTANFNSVPVGNAQIEFVVDPANQVQETNDNNNTRNQAVRIAGAADLVVSRIIRGDVPNSYRALICNEGRTAVSQGFDVEFFDDDASDFERFASPLEEGACGWIISENVLADDSPIRVIADVRSEISEINEGNNSLTVRSPSSDSIFQIR